MRFKNIFNFKTTGRYVEQAYNQLKKWKQLKKKK